MEPNRIAQPAIVDSERHRRRSVVVAALAGAGAAVLLIASVIDFGLPLLAGWVPDNAPPMFPQPHRLVDAVGLWALALLLAIVVVALLVRWRARDRWSANPRQLEPEFPDDDVVITVLPID
jgi:hypothetical protein